MKKIIYLFILFFQVSWAQEVRVTDNKGTIHKIRNNKVTTTNIAPMSNPLEGDVWFNNSDPNSLITNIYDGSSWTEVRTEPESKAVILEASSKQINGTGEAYEDFPLNVNDLLTINNSYYTLNNTKGQITVLKDGNYLISAAMSVSDMPSNGSTKYILAFLVNGIRKGYLCRGYAYIPPNKYYWGASGMIMYPLRANDRVKVRYLVLKGVGTTLNTIHLNMGVAKI